MSNEHGIVGGKVFHIKPPHHSFIFVFVVTFMFVLSVFEFMRHVTFTHRYED